MELTHAKFQMIWLARSPAAVPRETRRRVSGMIVIADSGPLNYLVLIGAAHEIEPL